MMDMVIMVHGVVVSESAGARIASSKEVRENVAGEWSGQKVTCATENCFWRNRGFALASIIERSLKGDIRRLKEGTSLIKKPG
jgi:hypothetical protein